MSDMGKLSCDQKEIHTLNPGDLMFGIEVKIRKLNDSAIIPTKAHPDDAGYDLYSSKNIEIPPMMPRLVPTGIALDIPSGIEGQIRPRSGLALKKGITVLNSPGTIDSGYHGEICVILFNTIHLYPQKINRGDRIAQIIFSRIPPINLVAVDKFEESDRGTKGFGSTGI